MYLIIVIVSLMYERIYKNDNHVNQWAVGTIIESIATADHEMTRNPLANRDIVWCFFYQLLIGLEISLNLKRFKLIIE
jgi:hypothetical protein